MNELVPAMRSTPHAKQADQKFCHSCGLVLHHSAAHCTGCGAQQGASPLAPFPMPMPAAAGVPAAPGNLPPHHVYCRGCGGAIHESAPTCPKCGAPQRVTQEGGIGSGRSRTVAAMLAFFLGGLGAHRFYVGSILLGLVYLVFCWTFIPAMVSLVEGIYFLTLSDSEFARRYP